MKKFMLGLLCGIGLTASTAVLASETISAYLFPATFEINGKSKELDSEYKVLNYNNHAYVPIRFISESLGLGVRYIDRDRVISISNEPTNADETARKVWLTQYRLNVGNDEVYVRSILGAPYAERTNDDNQQAVWRYDFAAASDYQYNGLSIDLEGLKEGKVNGQLIIHWSDDGKVNRIELWASQGTGTNRQIYTHYVYPDGSTGGALYE
ncbi:stalk domain-containing protein [Paenibacillus roseipurpureus]|uniref:Stalk domain-containing protein n=1 Tax=Paenibacillus roseopurpureus TaxID=2918901 RepID=A0AA96LQL0_9BACL|nr:stalk domain-containing protein [Paenibacillus sp. MBLB1832]WNR45359.1 stalk domain-containing protein [Paenibacillus sp. MBLB1832]